MATLVNNSKKTTVLTNLQVATSFWARAKGLIGTSHLNSSEGVYFPRTNWIHTLFMSMPIDVVYVDKNMVVCKIDRNLQPWKFPAPVLKANGAIELASGTVKQNIEVGDQLYVGH